MTRERRQEAIRRILLRGVAPSQEALLAELAAQGLHAAQGTLSRDLRELGAMKGHDGYRLAGSTPEPAPASSEGPAGRVRPAGVLARHVVSVRPAQALVVVRTTPGGAGVVALELDRHPPQGLAGTVAGDDTVLAAVSEHASPAAVSRRIARLAGLAPDRGGR
jgi:transcriptional regulator of arginine metabolism